jgi:lysophospholipase L1-like esterase
MKTLGTVAAVVLAAITGLLAGAVMTRMNVTEPPRFSALPLNDDVSSRTAPQHGAADIFDQQVVAIGDFTAGSDEGGQGEKNWTAQVGALMDETRQVRIVTDTSSGAGSGYVTRGSGLTFPDQVTRLVSPATDVVVVSGSRNDIVAAPGEVKAAATQTFRHIAGIAPGAVLVVIGPTWIDDDPPMQLLATSDAVASAAGEAGAQFVDPIADHWLDAEAGLVGRDNVHPTDAGHTRIAALMTPVISAAMDRQVGR